VPKFQFIMASLAQRVRPWAKRATIAAGATTAGLVAFPRLEDAYWMSKDPERVLVGGSNKNSVETPTNTPDRRNKKNLIILGTGWASVSVLKHIDRDKYNVTIVSPRNYFLFTPLLPSVSSGTVTPEAVTVPIREFTSYKALPIIERFNFLWRGYLPEPVKYLYAAASDIDPVNKVVTCEHQSTTIANNANKPANFNIPYDVLVIATGATTNTFNTEGVDEYAHFLKETGDATLLRQAVLENLEKASLPSISEEEQKRLLSFWVVGGGPTAVEFAAELQDFLYNDVVNPKHATFHQCANKTKVTLVQSNDDLLPGYPKKIRDFSLKHMKDIGINVITGARATKLTDNAITIYDKSSKSTTDRPYGLAVWATGVTPVPLIQNLINKIPLQASFRTIKTDSRCEVIGGPGIYAAGDCADIDVQVEYEVKVSNIIDALKQQYPAGTNSEHLSRDASEALVKELHSIGGIVSAPGAKIAKDIANRLGKQNAKEGPSSRRGLTKVEIQDIVKKHLKRQKVLPPTAQVAHQQGEYLANLLNDPKINPVDGSWSFDHGSGFEFTNLGQMVYVGGHMAALSVPATKDVDVSWNGSLTNYIWHAAYFGMLESVVSRSELLFDWIKTYMFGRSTALEAICSLDSNKHVKALRRGSPNFATNENVKGEKKKIWWKIF